MRFIILFSIALCGFSQAAFEKQILQKWPNEQPKKVYEGKLGDYHIFAGYFEDGKKRMIMKCERKDDKMYLVKATSNDHDGKIISDIKDGNGEFKVVFSNGKTEYIEYYKQGRLEGETTYWWENGNLSMKGSYLNGKKQGPWKVYTEAGVEQETLYFIEDKQVNQKEWFDYKVNLK